MKKEIQNINTPNIDINEKGFRSGMAKAIKKIQSDQKLTHKELVKKAGLPDDIIKSIKLEDFDFSLHEFILICENLNINYSISINDNICAENINGES